MDNEDLPGGEPRMSETMASRAILMFCTEPRMWMFLPISIPLARQCKSLRGSIERYHTYVSARTIRVLLAFSIENFTFPPSPAIRPDISDSSGEDGLVACSRATRATIERATYLSLETDGPHAASLRL